MSVQIGTYSKKKVGRNTDISFMSINVNIPKGRRVKGRSQPYKSQYLEDDFEDIQNDIRKELNISGHVKLVPTSPRGGRIVVI